LLVMFSLAQVLAAQASLLLNVEEVLTAVLARFSFGEPVPRPLGFGMGATRQAAVLVAWKPGETFQLEHGALVG